MNRKTWGGILLCVAAAAVIWRWPGLGPTPVKVAGERSQAATAWGAPDVTPVREEVLPEVEEVQPAEEAVEPVAGTVAGDLRDTQGLLPWPAGWTERPAITLCPPHREAEPVDRVTVDDDGIFRFARVLPGEYYVLVDPKTLHPDYLPPHRQESAFGSLVVPGYWATPVTMPKTGGDFQVSLVVHRKACVEGHVYDMHGIGAPKVMVRLHTADMPRGPVSLDAHTDETGYFRFPGVYPGRYRTHLAIGDNHPLRGQMYPVPRDVLELLPGQQYSIALRFGPAGDGIVEGALIDQDGLPVEGIAIDCYYRAETPPGVHWHTMGSVLARTWTDAKGAFRFEGLPREKIGINIDPNFRSDDPDQALAKYTRGVFLDLREGKMPVVLEPIRVERNRPFIVKGRVEIGQAFREANRLRDRDLKLEVVFVTEEGEKREAVGVFNSRFTWRCQCPHPPVVLHLMWPKGGLDSITPLEPRPFEVEENLVIRFP